MIIRKERFNYYVRKIEDSDSIEIIDEIESMIIAELGGNPDTLTQDIYFELSDLVDKKRLALEKMIR